MMNSDFIIDVGEADFEYEVITYSKNTPVIVDFWAEWCRPCKVLGPLLERLVKEAGGAFRLARVDVDHNPNLAMRYSVRSIPTVKAFSQGQVVAEFTGVQPEERLREFLSKISPPSPAELLIEKADSILSLHRWSEAEKMYREALEQDPAHPAALLGLAKALLAQDQALEAHYILKNFPASRYYQKAQTLRPLVDSFLEFRPDDLGVENDLDAAFRNSLRLAQRGNLPAAIDGMLDVLRQDRRYGDGEARRLVLGLLDLLGEEDPQTRQYRSELASILF